jgi:hypothetical protein
MIVTEDFARIERLGRGSLDEMRGLLSVLRSDGRAWMTHSSSCRSPRWRNLAGRYAPRAAVALVLTGSCGACATTAARGDG